MNAADRLMIEALKQLEMPRPGWIGSFATTEILGAYRNGTRVQKVDGIDEGGVPLGTLGTVLGSLSEPSKGIAYFVEWDAMPKCAVLVMAFKIEAVA